MEIDKIFGKIKKNEKEDSKKDLKQIKKIKKKNKKIKQKSQKRKFVEGLKVYTQDELKLGQSKNTPDCPFDCQCCF